MPAGSAEETGSALEYLEDLVHAAIGGRSTRSADVAGRMVAVLLQTLTALGGSARALRYLAPLPGGTCTVAVQTASGTSDCDLSQAFDTLMDPDRDGQQVGVVTTSPGGLSRRCLLRTADGAVLYLWPVAQQMRGPDEARRDAEGSWTWTLSTWARPGSEVPGADGLSAAAVATGAPRAARLARAEIVDAVQEALGEVAVEVDISNVEEAVTRAVTATMPTPLDAAALATRVAAALPHVPAPTPAPALDLAALAADLAPLLAPVIAGALGATTGSEVTHAPSDPPTGPLDGSDGPLADRDKAGRGGADDTAAAAGTTTGGVSAPTPVTRAVTAEEVAAQVVAVLAPVISAAVVSAARERSRAEETLAAADQRLRLTVDGVDDRLRSGTRALEALADSLAAADRSAAASADRMAHSVAATVERLTRALPVPPRP